MTVVGTIAGQIGRVIQSAVRSEEVWGAWARGDDLDGTSLSGVTVTRETSMQLSAVWSCVRLLSDTIASLPVDTFQRRDGVRVVSRPRPAWLDEPNPEQTRLELVEQQVGSLLLDGTAFIRTPRNRRGDVVELWNVHPDHVRVYRQDGRVLYDVFDESGQVTLDRTEMIHIPAFAWPGQIRGVSPVEHARRVFGLGLAGQEFAERFYGQGMNMRGLVEHPEELKPDEAKRLKDDFRAQNSGLRRSHLPAVLTGGAKWTQLTVTPEQAEFLGSRKFSVAEIARWFRVPPHLISDTERSTSWGTGIEEQNIGWVTYGLRSWIERIEQSYTRWLLGPVGVEGRFVKFNIDGLLRGNVKDRYESYAKGRQWGWLNADDIREKEDMPPLPEGQGRTYLVPTNMADARDDDERAS